MEYRLCLDTTRVIVLKKSRLREDRTMDNPLAECFKVQYEHTALRRQTHNFVYWKCISYIRHGNHPAGVEQPTKITRRDGTTHENHPDRFLGATERTTEITLIDFLG